MTYMKKNLHFLNLNKTHYGRTDGPTDGRTDGPSYRDARTHLKRLFIIMFFNQKLMLYYILFIVIILLCRLVKNSILITHLKKKIDYKVVLFYSSLNKTS